MEHSRLRECLADDDARLRGGMASADPGAVVPSCPGWTAGNSTRVAQLRTMFTFVAR
jgi:hypothetical protein